MQTREQLLKNLAKARAVRKQNLAMRRRIPQRKIVQPKQRRIFVPAGQPLFNPRKFVNPDLDVSRTDNQFNESIGAKGEGLFTNLDDVCPRILQLKRRKQQ